MNQEVQKFTRLKLICSLLPLMNGIIIPVIIYFLLSDSIANRVTAHSRHLIFSLPMQILIGSGGCWLFSATLFFLSEFLKDRPFVWISISGLIWVSVTESFSYAYMWSRGWNMIGVMSPVEGIMGSLFLGLLSGGVGIGIGWALFAWRLRNGVA